MSAVFYSNELVSEPRPKAITIDIREGDWSAYLILKTAHRDSDPNRCYDGALAYKRQCAMAYLGRRAQIHGGVCSRTQPRILTPQFVSDLELANNTKRYQRYPWLETLLNLLAQIEHMQDEISATNVIALVPSVK